MLRTFLFLFVVGFTISASARFGNAVNLTHINEGIPRTIEPSALFNNDSFFSQNIIPVTGYFIEGRNLEFSFKYKSCGTFIKNTAFKSEYLRLSPTVMFVKLKLNPAYRDSTIQQATCTSGRSEISTSPRKISLDIATEISKQFPDFDVYKSNVIVANDYMDKTNMLDLTSIDAIDKFLEQ